jgi:4-aminobutyrate--pyruvate transaminase
MEFCADRRSGGKFDPSHKIAAKAVAKIQEHGVILRALPGDIVGFCPPLIITEDELHDLFDQVELAMDAMQSIADEIRT